jgi:hypothetical protein
VITQLPWPNEMRSGEKCTKNNADASHNNVRNTQEGVFATHNCSGGDEHFLGSAVEGYVEFYCPKLV